jgi:hypothetical protein
MYNLGMKEGLPLIRRAHVVLEEDALMGDLQPATRGR